MVFFTCNNCGESLKKAAVEKHYNMRCRSGGIFVSCMDCQKDFRDDYVGHTKCITEAEKYSGKDYVPKESKNSGQRKQESWLEIVRSILATKEYEVSPVVRGIFQKLQSYENVPRKKAKFENFVKNSMRVKQDQAAAVWAVLEIALDKLKAQKNGEAQKNGGSSEGADGTNQQNGNSANGVKEEITEAPAQPEEKPKKKKKKSKTQQAEEQNGTVAEVEANEEEPPKNKKKKKSKTQQAEEQNGTVAEVEENGEEPPKKKKKKNIEAKTENETDSATQRTNGHNEEVSEKKKAKKSKDCLEDSNAADSEKKKENAVLNFDWNAVIFKILGKHNDEMVLEDLKSKVLKRYRKNHQIEDIPYKVEKTFNKKIKKSGLLLEGNVVRITAK